MVLLGNFLFIGIAMFVASCSGEDPTVYYELVVSYITASPLGVPQQVISVNGKLPGPLINATTNNNIVVNVWNKLDEDILLAWNGIQMRQNSWQDGVLGTNCPIPPKCNWTYRFQVKDQIGSFFYSLSINLQRASGGFGPLIINNREVIPIPFSQPDGEYDFIIGDWYTKGHVELRRDLDSGQSLGIPDGVLINGKGPYQYNSSLVPGGFDYERVVVEPGKTYRLRVHNVGISTSLNFRIQNHNLLLAEAEGYYTIQQNYSSFDIHVGQSYSFLVTMDQNAASDYYIVASARFVNGPDWEKVTGVAVLHYTNSGRAAAGPLPDPPNDVYDNTFSLYQARSVRQNVSASGPRPNPQGSFHYGSKDVTDLYLLEVIPSAYIDGKLRAAINGLSFVNPDTPITLADQFGVRGAYKLDFPNKPLAGLLKTDRSVINGTYKGFIEFVLQNNDSTVHSYHMDGYSFFVVGMDYGQWTENSRGSYNMMDAICRCTIQVFSFGWTAILVSLDNAGVWNIRAENLDRWYLGEETYIRVDNPEENRNEFGMPENVLYCGALKHLERHPSNSSSISSIPGVSDVVFTILLVILASLCTS